MDAVVGGEEQRAADRRSGRDGLLYAARRADVLDQDGAGLGAVGLPQLAAVDAVVGGEEQRAADRRSRSLRVAAVGAVRVDVLDQDGAGLGAVGLPQLAAVDAVVGGEEQRRRRQRSGPGGCGVAVAGLMSLTRTVPASVPSDFHSSAAVDAVVGGEEERAADARSARATAVVAAVAGLMSLTRTVPASVPSDFHSSSPWVPSSAVKNNVSPTRVSCARYDPAPRWA